jgi:hypothetical protein
VDLFKVSRAWDGHPPAFALIAVRFSRRLAPSAGVCYPELPGNTVRVGPLRHPVSPGCCVLAAPGRLVSGESVMSPRG